MFPNSKHAGRVFPALLLFFAALSLPQPLQAQDFFDNGLDVPYVPSPQEVVTGMLKLAGVKEGDTVIDLGCGDGRIVVTAAREFGARGIGYDLDPERIKEANENAVKSGVRDKVKFVEKNLFEADIKDASVVTLYLLPGVNEKLKPRLLAELKPGTRVVSHTFTMGDWKPEKQVTVNGRTLLLWVIPAKAAGK
jgi:2-polyprenyl-3-methyl-5-hydroxy-6-metoxy-1,4-benzoquinol methylase